MSQPQFTFTLSAPTPTPPAPPRRSGRFNKPLWLVGIGLLANAAVLLFSHRQLPDIVLNGSAYGQATPGGAGTAQMLGARGIYMMPAQLGPNTFGLYLMDVDSGTICVYRSMPESSRFSFMAARSYKYDRFMEDFNNSSPTPKEVQDLVEKQRRRLELLQKEGQPTVEQTPKPDENKPDPAPGATPLTPPVDAPK